MEDTERQQRERAYKIWEDEGRVEGAHDDHWQRAEDQYEATVEEASATELGTAIDQAGNSVIEDKTKKRTASIRKEKLSDVTHLIATTRRFLKSFRHSTSLPP